MNSTYPNTLKHLKLFFSIYEPKAIGKLVSYFNPKSLLTFEDALFYACLMLGLKFIQALYLPNYYIYLQQLAIQIRNSLNSLVYRKCKFIDNAIKIKVQCSFVAALKLSPTAMNEIGLGNIITVMTKDVTVFEKTVILLSDMWIEVVRTFLICYLIYMKMGPPGLVGVGTLVLVLPVQGKSLYLSHPIQICTNFMNLYFSVFYEMY